MHNRVFFFLFLIFSAITATARPGSFFNFGSSSQKTVIDSTQVNRLLKKGYVFLSINTGKTEVNCDSAYVAFNQALKWSILLKNPDLRIKCVEGIAATDAKIGNFAHLQQNYKTVIAYYQQNNNKEKEAAAWTQFGNQVPTVDRNGDNLRLKCFTNALALFKQTKSVLPAIEAQQNIAKTNMHLGNVDMAAKQLEEVLAAYKKARYPKLQYTYDLLADVSKLKLDMHDELDKRIMVVKLMRETRDTLDIETYYAKLAIVYSNLAMYPESNRELNHSIVILEKKHKFEDLYGNLSLLILNYNQMGDSREGIKVLDRTTKEYPPIGIPQQVDIAEEYGNCYRQLKQYDEAEKYYLEMMRLYKITAFNKKYYPDVQWMYPDLINYYEVIANFYILTGKYAKASFFTARILKLPSAVAPPLCRLEFQLMQFKIDSASGNYVEAIKYFELHKNLSDSLFNVTKSKQISELLIKYEADKKDKDILLKSNRIQLLTKQAQLQTSQVKQARATKNLLSVFAVMLLLLLGVSYNRYRLKRKNHDLLQKKQLEINLQNRSLQELNKKQEELLDDKEWLLREIHHRVRNNLQTSVSLLNLQSAYITNKGALDAIRSSQRRMQAMSLIHQKTYQSKNMATVDVAVFISELVEYLKQSFTNCEKISFDLQTEHIELNITQAIPLALIVNEAITNSMKYAFPRARAGKITVIFKCKTEREYCLVVEDDGVPFAELLDNSDNDSLAINLVRGLTDQLDGKLIIKKTKGTYLEVCFHEMENGHFLDGPNEAIEN